MTTKHRTQVSLLLTIVSLLLWTHSIIFAKLEIGYLGLIQGLPVTFFIGIACLLCASVILWTSAEKHRTLLCVQLLILVTVLWLVPSVTGGSPPVINHDYRNLGLINHIVASGHYSNQVSGYFDWPGTFIASAFLSEVATVDFESLISSGLIPLFMQLLYLLPLYTFLRNTLGESRSNYIWLGCSLFYMAQWVVHVHLNPQGLGFLFILILLALITGKLFNEKGTSQFTCWFMIVVMVAALSVIHFLTSLAALCILVVVFLFKRRRSLAFVLLVSVVIVAAWNLSDPNGMVNYILKQSTVQEYLPSQGLEPPQGKAAERALSIDPVLITEREITGRIAGSQQHMTVANIRLIYSSLFVVIGLSGTLFVCLRKRNRQSISLVFITLATLPLLILSSYTREMIARIYLFALPGMAHFGASLLNIKSKMIVPAMCLVLIACAPLHIIAHYGNQEIDYVSEAYITGATFFHDKTSCGDVYGAWPLAIMINPDRYDQADLSRLAWKDAKIIFRRKLSTDWPSYIAISSQDRKSHEYLYDRADYFSEIEKQVEHADNGNFIYINTDLKLYYFQN